MLGIVQLCILLFIRKQTQENGKVELSAVRDWAKKNMRQTSNDQISITVHRLANRDFVNNLNCGLLSYNLTAGNEEQLRENLAACKRALSLE